jgi:hypothetical protein
MPLQDTRDGRDLLRLFDRSGEALARLRAAMLAAEPPAGIPVSARDLTDYPDALDEPRPEGKPGATARRMAALLRAGNEED